MEETKRYQQAFKDKCPCIACNLVVNRKPLDLSEEGLENIIIEHNRKQRESGRKWVAEWLEKGN